MRTANLVVGGIRFPYPVEHCEPELEVAVQFLDRTDQGGLRHTSFKGVSPRACSAGLFPLIPIEKVRKIPDQTTGKLPAAGLASVLMIRERGAPSIYMGRTPHEGRDEMCARARAAV